MMNGRRRILSLIVAALQFVCLGSIPAVPAFAQFGGRVGDVVVYVVSSKGNPDFVSVPSYTVNTATGFVTEDPGQMFDEPFGPDFPGETRRKMHAEPGDVFNLIVQREGVESPYQYLLAPVKVMVSQGLLRLERPNNTPVDVPVGFYAPFPNTIDFGPNVANVLGTNLFWTNYFPNFPATTVAPPGYRSPALPSTFTNGIDYLLTIGTFVGIVPWVPLQNLYPASGWVQGIDRKLIDDDTALGVRVQILRLRPGKITPFFKVNANTHMWVLNGSLTITPAGGKPTIIANKGCQQPCSGTVYAFVPNGFAIQLSNPIAFTGPFRLPNP
jgi:hypothetical protein